MAYLLFVLRLRRGVGRLVSDGHLRGRPARGRQFLLHYGGSCLQLSFPWADNEINGIRKLLCFARKALISAPVCRRIDVCQFMSAQIPSQST